MALTGQYLASGGSRTNPAMSLVHKEAGLHLIKSIMSSQDQLQWQIPKLVSHSSTRSLAR